ncbi:MAG: 3'-5' exonuclease [Bdellovibrionaceae bacterium]|nr:3'-5' exonuclease [Pseudobdellovibrionaceae bacterium]
MNFIAFDLETTGTLAGIDRIVEVGFVRFVNGKPQDRYACLVDPQMPIPTGASRVNGITDDMVKGKPTIETLLESLTTYCGNDMLVAHNATFDFQFLLADYKKHEFAAPTGTVFDTLPLSRKIFPGLMNYKLASIAKHLNIETGTLHRADEDAEYCGHVFNKILTRLYGEASTPDWQDLIRFSGRPELKFPIIEKQLKQLDLFSV